MKTILFALGAVCAMAQSAMVSGDATGPVAVRLAGIQQQARLSDAAWHEERDCLLPARQVIARNASQRSANVSHDDLKALADEICAE
jgi:hypothetical protein